jgi:hypothetical protein
MSEHNEQTDQNERLFSEELGDWAQFALDAAVEFYTDGNSSPFLLAMDKDGQKQLVEMEVAVEASVDEVLEVARGRFSEMFPGASLYALVWDAGLNIEGEEHNGILAECGQKGEPHAWLFAQLYEGEVADNTFDASDDPFVLRPVDSVFERDSEG